MQRNPKRSSGARRDPLSDRDPRKTAQRRHTAPHMSEYERDTRRSSGSQSGGRRATSRRINRSNPDRQRFVVNQSKPRRRKIHRILRSDIRRFMPALVILAVLLIGVLIYFLKTLFVVGIGTPTFIDNVFIGETDISLSGQNYEQGAAKLEATKQEWLNDIFIFTYKDQSWPFSRASVNADIDFDNALVQAWNLGHVGTTTERKRQIETIRQSPVHILPKITYDDALVDAFVAQIAAAIDVAPVDAVIVPDVNKPVVVTESQTGLKVDEALLKEQIITLINMPEGDTSIPVETAFPEVTSDAVGFQTIAVFSTDVSFRNVNSRSNVRTALSRFNGVAIMPGEEVSFNHVVGRRDEAHGYKEATEYAGDMTTYGWGGGVCQASTTLYNALIMANMTIKERFNHGMTVSYVDPSLDAAVFYGSKDLVFQNNTEYPIFIYTNVTKETATVKIYGHRAAYFARLESVIVTKKVESTRKVYIDDTDGKHAYYTDEKVLQSEGKPGCESQGWIVYYDWDTKQEVSRIQASNDIYSPGASVYYRGVHERNGEITTTE